MVCNVPVGWTCKFDSVMSADQSLLLGLSFIGAVFLICVLALLVYWRKR